MKDEVASNLSLDKLSQDPVTTSFGDVDKTKYLPDDFGNNADYNNLHDQPYTWESGFFLTPGFYEGYFKSFCIKAGTYSPQEGNGRFYAELKGPKADIVAAIIDGFQKKTNEITQQEVQLLLWAIIAKTDFQKMSGPIKGTALKLLSPEQIARLSKGALDNYVSSQISKAVDKNPTMRAVLEAENSLRQKYYQGVRDYSEYEEIAMQAGIEPVLKGFDTGRWTKHPNGFFIRYIVGNYSKTRVQIYVPEDITTYRPIGVKGPSIEDHYMTIQGKNYRSRNSIATPSNNSAQRLIQTDLPADDAQGGPGSSTDGTAGTSGTGGTGGSSGPGGTGGNSTSSDNDGTADSGESNGSGESGGNNGDGSSANGSGNDGIEGSSENIPGGETEKNPFPCETVINSIADTTIKLEMRNQNLPGVLVAIFKGDSVIHMQAYGKMRYDHKLTLETRLQWASVSKSVTGVAALQMIEDGRLKLDEKASDVVVNWPQERDNIEAENGTEYVEDRYKDISLRYLLNNTSGIQHYGKGRDDATTTQYGDITFKFVQSSDYTTAINGGWNAKSSVEQFNKSILDFPPGTNYLYSSYGFNLAGAIIDSKVGYGYDDWVISHIKIKLGLQNFGVAHEPTNRFGYQFFKDGILNNEVLGDYEDVLPSGGWESTICDLATFTRALSSGELLEDHEALWDERNMYITDAKTVNGYGLGVKRSGINDTLRVFHGGTNKRSRSYIQFFPSDTIGVVMLAPFEQADLERLAGNLINDLGLREDLYKTKTKPVDRCRRGMSNGSDMFTGIWRKTGNSQLIRTGLSRNEFLDEIRIMRDDYGYYLADFEAHMTDDKRIVYDGVFKIGKKTQVLITELDVFEFRRETARLKEQGLEITEFEYVPLKPGLQKSDKIGFAAIMEQGAPASGYTQFNDMSDLLEFAEQQRSGSNLRIVDIETHPVENGVLCTAIYVDGTPTVLKSYSTVNFLKGFEQGAFSSLGNPVDIEWYKEGDTTFNRYISLWDPTDKTDYRTSFDRVEQKALRFCDFMEMHETNSDDGYELIEMDRLFTLVDE